MKNIFRLFTTKKELKSENKSKSETITESKILHIKISSGWNADPVSPDVLLHITGGDLVMTINLNYFAFDDYKEGDRAKITFNNCSQYSLNTCNDEGYWYGQYRIKPTQLPFGEFYEIIWGVDRAFPEPVTNIKPPLKTDRHFIFFFKDETFECLAEDYKVEFL